VVFYWKKNIGVFVKIVITTIIVFISAATSADFKSYIYIYDWNAEDGKLTHDRRTIQDLISLFTKEDVYIYHDIDIFGYTPRVVTNKTAQISHSD
jgi:hypothetical protein